MMENAMNDAALMREVRALLERMTEREMLEQLSVFTPYNGNRRLGIPHMTVGEACHGVRAEGATVFPQALSLGATFDAELIEEIGGAVAKEARAYGVHMVFSPMLALARDARWGRVEESFGEDPYLVSEMGCAYIHGLQGRGDERFDRRHVLCVAKHFAADGEPLKGINGAPVDISEESLRELHFLPFETAVRKAGVAGIMPAHHSLNRLPCHANKWLLSEVLRGEWGFDGVVISDMMDIPKLYAYGGPPDERDDHQHRVAQSVAQAAWTALSAGVDAELGGYLASFENRAYGEKLLEGITSGEYARGNEFLRRSAGNMLLAKMRLGLFTDGGERRESLEESNDYDDASEGEYYAAAVKRGDALPGEELLRPFCEVASRVDLASHERLAQRAAEEAAVLLKNDGLLPLERKKYRRVAVIGPNAAICPMGGYSSDKPRRAVSLLEGIKRYLGTDADVTYCQGCVISPDDNGYGDDWEARREEYVRELPRAVELAKSSDLVIAALGGNRAVCGENTDVDEIELTWAQRRLIRSLYETGTPVVLVLIDGRPHAIPWESEHVSAILQTFYLGQQTGIALARLLYGEAVPCGKLPMAIPRRASHIPVLYNAPCWASPKAYIGSNMPCSPLYPFGFGMSYTRFEISPPLLDRDLISRNETASVSVTVKNVGTREGAEVVQLYIRDEFASVVRPMRELKGFRRVLLAPGEQTRVSFSVGFEQLKFYKDRRWTVETGEFSLYVGNSAACASKVVLRVE